jgi:hypothetical protein
MYENGKMRPGKIISGMGEGERQRRMMKEVNSRMIHLIYCKNFCKCHRYAHPVQQ